MTLLGKSVGQLAPVVGLFALIWRYRLWVAETNYGPRRPTVVRVDGWRSCLWDHPSRGRERVTFVFGWEVKLWEVMDRWRQRIRRRRRRDRD